MAILKRLDYLVKETSGGEITTQQNGVLGNLNTKQEVESNKLGSEYKIYYYATLFDPRSKKEYYIFSDVAKTKFELSKNVMDISSSGGGSGASINDETPSNENTYSSNYITNNFVNKTEFANDGVDIDFLTGL